MARNDFGEHKLLVIHQADTKAKAAGRTNIIMRVTTLYCNQLVRREAATVPFHHSAIELAQLVVRRSQDIIIGHLKT